jgi:hypothetical protein
MLLFDDFGLPPNIPRSMTGNYAVACSSAFSATKHRCSAASRTPIAEWWYIHFRLSRHAVHGIVMDKWHSVSSAPLSSGFSFGPGRHLGAQAGSERTLLARTRWGRSESAPRTCAEEGQRRCKCQGRRDMKHTALTLRGGLRLTRASPSCAPGRARRAAFPESPFAALMPYALLSSLQALERSFGARPPDVSSMILRRRLLPDSLTVFINLET